MQSYGAVYTNVKKIKGAAHKNGDIDGTCMSRDDDKWHGVWDNTSARGFIPKKIQWHIHAGSWSLVNCLAGSLYEALYKVLTNIN